MNIYLSKIKLDIYKGLRSNKTIGWTLEGYNHKHENNIYCSLCNNGCNNGYSMGHHH